MVNNSQWKGKGNLPLSSLWRDAIKSETFVSRLLLALPDELSEDECWVLTKYLTPRGHGRITFTFPNGTHSGVQAHRLVWEETHESCLLPDYVIRHSCDNPPCVNPKHLIVGTDSDNVQDAIKRNRRKYVAGSKAARSKLTELQVMQIKKKLTEGQRNVDIAKQYNVHVDTIYLIKAGKIWKHVSEDGLIQTDRLTGTLG